MSMLAAVRQVKSLHERWPAMKITMEAQGFENNCTTIYNHKMNVRDMHALTEKPPKQIYEPA
jgi:phosphotransferase system HPr-like phosphotransfer protein